MSAVKDVLLMADEAFQDAIKYQEDMMVTLYKRLVALGSDLSGFWKWLFVIFPCVVECTEGKLIGGLQGDVCQGRMKIWLWKS